MSKAGSIRNLQLFIEGLCLFAFSGALFYITASGRYLAYVTPRMAPYLYFTALVTALWGGASFLGRAKPLYRVRTSHLFTLLLPLSLFFLPHSALASADLASGYSGGSAFTGAQTGDSSTTVVDNTPGGPESGSTPDEYATGGLVKLDTKPPPGLDEKGKHILVSDDAFYLWIEELFKKTTAYEGYTITLTGYVLKDPELFGEQEFVPARLAMVCCSADLTPVGLICLYENVSELTEGEWVTVEGEVIMGTFMGTPEPQVRVTKITPAQPVEGYIYP